MTLDEILSEQIKRLPPNLRAELQAPRRDTSQSLLAGGIGLSRPDTLAPRRGYPRDFAGRDTNVIVEGDQVAPAPAVRPQGADENALVRQAGFAAANSELAPLLSDWRTSPAAALTAAIGGYGRGSYAAQRDIAAGRAEAQKAEREAARFAAQEKLISQLPPDKRFLAELNPEAFAESELKRLNPAPVKRDVFGGKETGYFTLDESGNPQRLVEGVTDQPKPIQVGNDLVDPVTGALVYRAPFAPTQGREPPVTYQDIPEPELKALGLPPGTQRNSRGEFKFGPAAGGGEPLESVVGPDGKPILVPRGQASGMQPAAVRDQIGSEGEREDKRLFGILNKVRTAGSFDGLPAEDTAFYERKYRERSKPTVALDPTTGLITQTSPDVSDLLLPPSMQPKPAPPKAPPQSQVIQTAPNRPADPAEFGF